MANVLLVAYLLIVLAMIGVILVQRSEGGGLGIGGGGGGGLMTARGSANLLTRTTAILAALFFATAIGLTVLSEIDRGSRSILDSAAQTPGGGTDGAQPTSVLDALNKLQGDTSGSTSGSDLPVPATDATPATANAPAAGSSTTDSGLAVPSAPAADAAPAATDTAPPANTTTDGASQPAGTGSGN